MNAAVLALLSLGVGSAAVSGAAMPPGLDAYHRPAVNLKMSDTSPTRPLSLESLVQAALLDAERVTGKPRADLRVLDAAAVDWPDGSAGCPEPGVLYTQAVVPGYRIRIQAGDAVLNYHATRHSPAPVRCPAKRAQPALPPSGGIT
jgi:hypothetical protein